MDIRPTHISSAGLFIFMIEQIIRNGFEFNNPPLDKFLLFTGAFFYVVGTILWVIDYRPNPKKAPQLRLAGEKVESHS